MSGLSVSHLSKSYGEKCALCDVSFQVEPGEIVAVLGPSGCGKSTLLSIIAGLESPDQGEVAWNGLPLAGIPPHQRGFGLMFQDFALFPHRDVAENVAFGPKMQRLPESDIRQRVSQALELVGLPGFERRDVNTLSGGEQQRIALARALAPNPKLLMLDEPLGALDRTLRERLVEDLRSILRRSRQTALYVTHDQEEAFAIADRIVLLNAGKVEQIGEPQAIYYHPVSLFVARFLGMTNFLPGRLITTPQGLQVVTAIGSFTLPATGELHVAQPGPDHPVTVLLRPDALRLNPGLPCQVPATLQELSFRGSSVRAIVLAGGQQLTLELPFSEELPAPGAEVTLGFDPARAFNIYF